MKKWIFTAAVCAATAAALLTGCQSPATGNTYPTPRGLVGAWSGEGNMRDSGPGGHDGHAGGWSPVNYALGKIGNAFYLDGSSAVVIPDAPGLHFRDAMTAEAWIFPTRMQPQFGGYAVMVKYDSPMNMPGQCVFSFGLDTTLQKGYIIISTNGENGAALVYTSNSIIPNVWSHLAATYDGNAVKVYLNGKLESSLPLSGDIFPGTDPLAIGANTGGSERGPLAACFVGMIDEPRLYERALSAREIKSIYDAGMAINPANIAPPEQPAAEVPHMHDAENPAPQANIVRRPEQLKFPPLNYEPPSPADCRVVLKSGPVAYIVPDRELPLVNISVQVHVGSYLEPEGKEGLAGLTGYLLARGGTKSKSAEELEERLAFLAAQLNSSVGDSQGTVSLNLLSKDLDEGLGILREVLTAPRFQDDKIALRKQQLLQEMKQRNDDSQAIEGREYGFLAHGEDFWGNRYPTAASVDSISKADIEAFHQKWFHPDQFVLAVSGDFDRDEMVKKLETLFADWPFAGEKPTPIPTNTTLAAPGVYLVNKDVNQGRVSILLPGIMRQDPDYFAVQVMNDILGGGGFTSHIMSSVRSDEGLAYSAYSVFPGGICYPLTFTAGFQSKSRTVSYAVSIVLKEMQKMTEAPPTDKELNTAKRGYIDRFPHSFATKAQTAALFAQDEFTGRYAWDPGYFKEYRSRIKAVTKDDVERVAKKYLTPDKAVILIVGNKNDITMKLPAHPVMLQELTSGPVKDWPLRDPLTMKQMPVTESTAK